MKGISTNKGFIGHIKKSYLQTITHLKKNKSFKGHNIILGGLYYPFLLIGYPYKHAFQ